VVQSVARNLHWLDDRNLFFCEFSRKAMLLEDGIVAPAPGPIKLRDHRWAVFDADLINPILVAVEGEKSAVASKAEIVDRSQNVIWLKLCVSQLRFS